jgi:hypothetical protein
VCGGENENKQAYMRGDTRNQRFGAAYPLPEMQPDKSIPNIEKIISYQ